MEYGTTTKNKQQIKQQFKERFHKYVVLLIKTISALPSSDVSREIKKQVIRSGASVGANYFEAQSASSKRDYIQFLTHALKSANETKFWLQVIIDSEIPVANQVSDIKKVLQESTELASILGASILTLKGKRSKD